VSSAGPHAPATGQVFTVSQLTRLIRETLVEAFPALWVKGELSGVKRAPSGHVYFTLKEGNDAVIDCVMWRDDAPRLSFEPADGMQVEAFGGISVYAPRGRYQLYVRDMRPAGLGALLLELEELKRRLQAEGLFDPERKRPLPAFPRAVGLVTSPGGAAVRDMIKVLRERWPSIRIVLAPVKVQGEGASIEIAAAIRRFNAHGEMDVLIVGRGGGSLEDLWAFNEEPVVRAVAASRIPVIAGVGHEVDLTLAELAADRRAATPSNAAEIAVPDRREVARRVDLLRERTARAARRRLDHLRRTLAAIVETYGFRRQRDLLAAYMERVDRALAAAADSVRRLLRSARERLAVAGRRHGLRSLPRALAARRDRGAAAHARLASAVARLVEARRSGLAASVDRLRALGPQRVLERGFCIARAADGTLLRAAQALDVGDLVALEFARGSADARVETVRPGGDDVR
jgi:exodeoxyribonuclease VII large subunit